MVVGRVKYRKFEPETPLAREVRAILGPDLLTDTQARIRDP